jgi:hypothetical protein
MTDHDTATGYIGRGVGAASALLERPVASRFDVGPELDVLRVGAAAGLGCLLPRMRFDLRDRPAVVVDVVEGRSAADLADAGRVHPALAAGIGAALGAWHRGASTHLCGFRFAPDTPPPPAGIDDMLLAVHVRAFHESWQPLTVIHGDCSLRSATVTGELNGCAADPVVLTGWGRAGLGDPAWDLGCLVADLLGRAHQWGPASVAEPSIAAAVSAYGRTTGPHAWGGDFARRSVLAVVQRLSQLGRADHPYGSIDVARSVAAWLPNWTGRFEQWLT